MRGAICKAPRVPFGPETRPSAARVGNCYAALFIAVGTSGCCNEVRLKNYNNKPSLEPPGSQTRSGGTLGGRSRASCSGAYPAAAPGQLLRGSPRLGTCGDGRFFGRPQVKLSASPLPSVPAQGGLGGGGGLPRRANRAGSARRRRGGSRRGVVCIDPETSTKRGRRIRGGGGGDSEIRGRPSGRAHITSAAARAAVPAAQPSAAEREPSRGSRCPRATAAGCRNGAGVVAGCGRHDRRGGRAGV